MSPMDAGFNSLARAQSAVAIFYNVVYLMSAAAVMVYVAVGRALFTRCMRQIVGPSVLESRRLQENELIGLPASSTSLSRQGYNPPIEFVATKAPLAGSVGQPERAITSMRMPADLKISTSSDRFGDEDGAEARLPPVSPYQHLLAHAMPPTSPVTYMAATSRPGSAVPRPRSGTPTVGAGTGPSQAHFRSVSPFTPTSPVRPSHDLNNAMQQDDPFLSTLQRSAKEPNVYPPLYPPKSPEGYPSRFTPGRTSNFLSTSPPLDTRANVYPAVDHTSCETKDQVIR
ncbi:hypothetical protein HK405_010531, partial [Cladochytrium tenue]